MALKLKNNATTTLASALDTSSTTVTVADGSVFPTLGSGDYFNATIQATTGAYEIVQVTAIAGNALSVTRAQEGTVAISHSVGALVDLRLTEENVTGAVIADDYLIL